MIFSKDYNFLMKICKRNSGYAPKHIVSTLFFSPFALDV